MILAAYLVTGLPGRLGLRGRDAARAARPPPPARAADPADGRLRSRRRSSSRSATRRRARSPRTSRSSSRRWSACSRPRRDVTEYIYGRCTSSGVKGGIGIPGFDSFLVGWSTDTKVTGLDSVPADDRPPANTMLHWAFDTMVGICTALIALGLWLGFAWWRKRDIPQTNWFLRAVAVSGVAAIVALECGWIVTEVGRQPWIVYNVMRTKDAVTGASGVWVTFVDRARALHRARDRDGAHRCGRWRGAGARRTTEDRRARTGPASVRRPRSPEEPRVSSADAVAAVLWVGVTLYAVFGGADFGAGLLGLVAGERRARPARARADRLGDRPGLGGQPRLADLRARRALDGVLRRVRVDHVDAVHPAQPGRARDRAARLGLRLPQDGAAGSRAGDCRRAAVRRSRRCSRRSSWAPSSARSPSGRVPVGNAAGDPVTSWLNPLSLLVGALFVATVRLPRPRCSSSATRAAPGAPDLERYFTRPRARGRRSSRARSPSPASSSCTPTRATSTTA